MQRTRVLLACTLLLLAAGIVGGLVALAVSTEEDVTPPVISEWPGAVDMMRILPADVGDFNYADVSMQPARWWDNSEWKEHFGEYFLGQSWDKLRNMGFCDGGTFCLWAGSFDTAAMRRFLDSRYEVYPHRNVKVWVDKEYSKDFSAAIVNDIVITGYDEDVRRCIDVAKDGAGSLWDDENYRGVLDRLPKGIGAALWSPLSGYRPGVLVMGTAETEDDGILTETTVYRCEDEDLAKAYVAELEGPGLQQVARDGVYVISTSTSP
jgi:hypothetical protein